MAFFVSDEFAAASDLIQQLMQIVIVILIPSLTVILLIILAPIFACCCCIGQRAAGLHKRVIGVAQHIFCFLEKKGSNFVLFGYKAPVCYTYYLLFLAFIICIHSFFTFWDSAFHNSTNTIINNWDPIYRYLYCLDIFNVTQKTFPFPNDTVDLKCIEVHLLDGIENAATTFGLSALAVAIITWILLTCSKGNRARKQTSGRLLCIPVIMLFQVIGLFVPRIIFLYYLSHVVVTVERNLYWTYDSTIDAPVPAVTNEESLFAGIAILDAVSLTMLTPWLCFEKIDPEEEDNVVTSPRLKSTNQTFEMA